MRLFRVSGINQRQFTAVVQALIVAYLAWFSAFVPRVQRWVTDWRTDSRIYCPRTHLRGKTCAHHDRTFRDFTWNWSRAGIAQ